MDLRSAVAGLAQLREETSGDPEVTVAVLDGPVDVSHPCFAGADLRVLPTLVPETATDGSGMAVHGTHVASVLFGQPGTDVEGVAPRCRALVVPVFSDERPLSQVDLARAIEQAVAAGADIVSVSGGQHGDAGQPDGILANALSLCEAQNVLVVAAVGNDGAERVQVPAAVSSVLAVGAADARGVPLPTNNRGMEYVGHVVLAPGDRVRGAKSGGGTIELSGSSVATPVVAGAAALLVSRQRAGGRSPDPGAAGREIVANARLPDGDESHLAVGHLDLSALSHSTRGDPMTTTEAPLVPSGEPDPPVMTAEPQPEPADSSSAPHVTPQATPASAGPQSTASSAAGQSQAATGCGCGGSGSEGSPLFVIGSIGHDFGTEANRDGFVTLMPTPEGRSDLPPNPYDPHQLHDFLRAEPWFADKLIWLCKHEAMPIYALEAELPVGLDWGETPSSEGRRATAVNPAYPPSSYVHRALREALKGQALDPNDPNFVSRVSIPGRLTHRTVRLFSGQVVPVVKVQAGGLYTWNEAQLIESLVGEINTRRTVPVGDPADEETVKLILRAFLDKVYYQFRNLGQSGPDRALNYAATNAFSLVSELASGFLSGRLTPRRAEDLANLYALDDISVQPSQYSRLDSECYDVIITFFDPTNDRQARVAYLYTIDVSEVLPVPLAPTRQFMIRT